MQTGNSQKYFYRLALTTTLVMSVALLATTHRAAAQATTDADSVIGFDQAIHLAVENNYALKQAKNNLEGANAQVKSAKADFFPSVSASLSGSQRVGRQFDNIALSYVEQTSNSFSGNIGAQIQLFKGFENIKQLRQAEAGEDFQQETMQRARENVIFNAASRYLQVLIDKELLTIARENLEASERQMEQVQSQVEVGSRPKVDLYNQESTVASNELTVIQRENQLKYDKTRLIRTLQLDPSQEYQFSSPELDAGDVDATEYRLDKLTRQALNNRSDLMAQEHLIEQRKYGLELAKTSFYPTLSASAGIYTSYRDQYRGIAIENGQRVRETVGFSDQFFDQLVTRSMGFDLNIPIFSQLNRSTSVQQARIDLKNAKLDLENQKYGVQEEIRQAYNDYTSLAKELETTNKALRAARKTYETQQERYSVGSSTLVELSQANADYVQARANRVQALYNFIFQEKLLDYYLGKLDESITLE